MWRQLSSSRRNTKSDTPTRPPLGSPRSTLAEVLRVNQFRAKNASSPALSPGQMPELEDASVALNKDLAVLANIYTDVKYECLRELLLRFDGDSRLLLVTEELVRHNTKWTQGRKQVPPRDLDEVIPLEDRFRTEAYKRVCAGMLYKEFNSLNKSAVDAVLAEVNDSYTRARPVLQEILTKSWRSAVWSILRKRKDRDTVPQWLWEKGRVGFELVPSGNIELDHELDMLYGQPSRGEAQAEQEHEDYRLARRINEREAQEANATYECQICFNDVPFEEISCCTAHAHVVCLDCVRRSLSEAVFGQNWARSVESDLGTLRCLAPVDTGCTGYVPAFLVKQAVLAEASGDEMWDKFEDRLAEKAIFESQVPLARCPFCSYAEVEEEHSVEAARQLEWTLRPMPIHHKVFFILACEILLPGLLLVALISWLLFPTLLPTLFYRSLAHLANSLRTSRFRCLRADCGRASCRKCYKVWHDVHVCHEPLLLSLRQSVETARTNAVKRVCPRCGTAFVKSSGCNKLTCVCGYSMCYLCRKNIGKTGENEGAEGYRHFCEHFRPVPGQRCTQCDKCDLYKNEEEDVLVRRAGEEAEREWREKQGQDTRDLEGIRIDHHGMVGRAGIWDRFIRGDWTVQGLSDWLVREAIIVKI